MSDWDMEGLGSLTYVWERRQRGGQGKVTTPPPFHFLPSTNQQQIKLSPESSM